MSTLPVVPQRRGVVLVDGQKVAVRSLTRAEALRLRGLEGSPGGNAEAEALTIAFGTDAPEEEAAEWWRTSDATAVGELVRGILVISRLLPKEAGKTPNSKQSDPSSRGT